MKPIHEVIKYNAAPETVAREWTKDEKAVAKFAKANPPKFGKKAGK